MAIKEPFMVKNVIGNEDLELSAGAGESLLIKDVFIENPMKNYVTMTIDKVTVGYFRVGKVLGSHLPFPIAPTMVSHDISLGNSSTEGLTDEAPIKNAGGTELAPNFKIASGTGAATYKKAMDQAKVASPRQTILAYLQQEEIFKGYPIGEGQKFVIKGAAQDGAIQTIIYEVYEAGDMKPSMPDGSEATEYIFLNYGNTGDVINSDGDTLYNKSVSPAEFPDFPFGKTVDPGKTITLLGILGSNFAPTENSIDNYIYTKYLKMMADREILFDQDRNGLLHYAPFPETSGNIDYIGAGYGMIGNHSTVDVRSPFIFTNPLEYVAGTELNIFLTTETKGSPPDISIDEQEIGLIEKVSLGGKG